LTQGRLGVPDRLADNRFDDLHHRKTAFGLTCMAVLKAASKPWDSSVAGSNAVTPNIQAGTLRWSSS